ncbi:snRNA-activating protein complex subunit 4 [Xyrichtys novacula]|uniref:snRNA-activating protein complex subunit 4 n=1 Tax=Xyrichtys novacula TaxID=13765 RepID=A0AAV1G9Y4_XYRNO|nr:snRNA-activating protein complex subunit 4 [Xyrichtys novacula]
MSVSLAAERDRLQRQVEELEQSLSATNAELELLSSDTDEESVDDGDTNEESTAGLLAQRDKIQKEIQNLESFLGPHSPVCVSDDDNSSSSSSDESELGLAPTADSCLQLNLVYQQVIQETLDRLETLLTQNKRQQREVVAQLSGPNKEALREQNSPSSSSSSLDQHHRMFLGRFFKPYFKDKLTGLGPPANRETKEKASRMIGCLDERNLKLKRWESWQKTLLIHAIARDTLRRLVQPKLSKMDFLSKKMASAAEADKQLFKQQMEDLEKEINMLKNKKKEELIGDRFDEHDWQKICNVDFEGTRDAEDIQRFWQNFLHPSVNKSTWTQEEVNLLKGISERHKERNWETIAEELGTGRTAFLCLQTFQRFISKSLKRSNWTPEEDALLKELVEKMRIGNFIPYTQMSYFIEGHDPSQLIYRWTQVLDPSLKKGPWTKEEDELLLKAVSYYGEKDWWKIRLEVPGRTDGACRDRYLDCLKADIRRGAFDREEVLLLKQLVEKHGVGRWSKIAAEIPHRHDAQCLREWRKLSASLQRMGQSRPKNRQQTNRSKKPSGEVVKRTRSKPIKVKEESTDEEEEEKEEEDTVVYMDSDEEERKAEKKKEIEEWKKVQKVEKKEEEKEEEEEYPCLPMKEWIPAERVSPTVMVFQPVELPPAGDQNNVKCRLTILGSYGRSVIIGPRPKLQPCKNRHSSRTMMMVSADQLRIYLSHQANKDSIPGSGPPEKPEPGEKIRRSRVTDQAISYQLQAQVIPWIGNILIPAKTRETAADTLRERGERRQLTSTSVFLLFLQTMNVDILGCKEVIERRRNRVMQSPPSPDPPPDKKQKNTKLKKSAVGALQKTQELDLLQKLILEQFHTLQQQKQKQRMQLQSVYVVQQAPSPNKPGVLLKMPPHMHPQMLFPQPVFIPQPVTQPTQFMSPFSPTKPTIAPHRSPPAPQRVNVAPLPVVTMPVNATSPPFAPPCQPGLLPPSPDTKVSTSLNSSSPVSDPNQPCLTASSLSSNLTSKTVKIQEAVISSPNGVDINKEGDGSGGKCTADDVEGDSSIKSRRRIRKPSQKAKDVLEIKKEKAGAKKKPAPSPKQRPKTKDTSGSPQGVCTIPVEVVPKTPPSLLTIPITAQRPPLSVVIYSPPTKTRMAPLVLAEKIQLACSDGRVSSTGNVCVVPPPPTLTGQQTASSTTLPLIDHGYSLSCPDPSSKSKTRGRSSKQPTQKAPKSGPAPKRASKAPPKKRKRVSEEDKQSVTSSQDEQCVSRMGDEERVKSDSVTVEGGAVNSLGEAKEDTVGVKDEGVPQDGKRLRKPSQRVRESRKVEAEVKKSTSPRKKRRCTPRQKKDALTQKQSVTPVPEMLVHPGQSMLVMSPNRMTCLQGMKVAIAPGTLQRKTSKSKPVVSLRRLAPRPTFVGQGGSISPTRHPPTFILQPVPNPDSSSLPLHPPSKQVPPTERAAPPPLRNETLQFDPALMFLESRVEVQDWLSGKGGVVVPGAGVTLPYLPPFVSSLTTLSGLLSAKKSLIKLSMQLLGEASETQPKPSQNTSKPDSSSSDGTSSQPSDLPDSTSDLQPATKNPGTPFVSSEPQERKEEEEEEEKLVAAVRQLVAERFSENAGYQLLKARFLSCFTVPALMASMEPITVKTVAPQSNEEEEGEEEEQEEEEEKEKEKEKGKDAEEELQKTKGRGRRCRAKRSLLKCDGPGAPANHFSGMNSLTHTHPTGGDKTATVQ